MPDTETRFAVLLFTDIVGSTDLKARHGVPAFSAALRKHNDHFERIARECRSVRILHNMGDGYFAETGSVAEAVKFALLFQEALREETWANVPLATRVGIHAGELSALEVEGGSGIVAPAADLAARVMSLAVGGQVLLTRFPFDEARHFIREHPPVAGKTMPPLCWLAHGPYLLKGRDEPMEIFEVGAEGLAPLTAPPDSEKAKRAIRPGEEETLGWRPAVGLEIPGRTGWHLTEKLGAGGFGEVWTGEHAKLHQRRAFKFCFDDERLRALKREVTLVRLLRTALGERDDIVHIHELKLDAPPFYLESDLAPHGNLLQWAERQGGLGNIPLAQRIALVAHTATALAAAHSIGVLHKDIKPTNILIFDGPGGEPRPRLVDFGIGTLADSAVLGQHGVTGAGFTRATIQHSTGTPTYSPPEYLAGKPYTIQGDIYGLGVLLYQLVAIRLLEPVAHGWERDIADPLVREDIAACVDGDPARRLPGASDLAKRLLHLDQRRAEIANHLNLELVPKLGSRLSERLRAVDLKRAAALLYGELGRQKIYILLLAVIFVIGVRGNYSVRALLMICTFVGPFVGLVAPSYIMVRCYIANGGGVYSSARAHGRALAVIGAWMLVADLTVTEALWGWIAIDYFNVPFIKDNIVFSTIGVLIIMGGVNWFGPRRTDLLSLPVVAIVFALVLIVSVLISLNAAHLTTINLPPLLNHPGKMWTEFLGIIFAISGFETIANIAGVLRLDAGSTSQPRVPSASVKPSRKAIIGVVFGTAVLGWTMYFVIPAVRFFEDIALNLGLGILLFLLLLSAANMAMLAIIGVFSTMALDGEMHPQLTKFNRHGVPIIPLLIAVGLPTIFLLLGSDFARLTSFYGIGMVGAMGINIGSCAFNRDLPLVAWQRSLLEVTFLILLVIELTFALGRHEGFFYVAVFVTIGLVFRTLSARRAGIRR